MTTTPLLRRAPVRQLPGLHQIILPTPWAVGPVQVYLIESGPLTLVDSGVRNAASRAALEQALETLGRQPEEIERVILTHYHGDHLGQVQSLRDSGAQLEVLCHQYEASMVEGFSAERDERIEDTEALFREFGVPEDVLERQTALRRRWLSDDPLCEATRVDRKLRSGERVAFKDFELEVVHAPGHTAGHLLLHEPHSGTLLTGDHVMGNAVPYTDNYYLEGRPDPVDPLRRRPRFKGLPRYMESLRSLRSRRFKTILPAHGGILDRPADAIEAAILFYEVRIQRAERALTRLWRDARTVSAWDLWRALFPKSDPVTEMRTRMYMVIGILDLLEQQGHVRAHRDDGGHLTWSRG